MMPNVNISNDNFHRLQRVAVPLVDDLDSTLTRLLDFYESKNATGAPPVNEIPDDLTVKTFSADAPPDLTFTSIKSITLDGKPFINKYWNPLLFELIGMVARKVGKEKLMSILDVNFTYEETKSFVFIEDAEIYVQGRDSNLCWRSIYKLLKLASISIEVDFYWQDKPTAAFPGRSGRFIVEAK